jgi:hypothetical protein
MDKRFYRVKIELTQEQAEKLYKGIASDDEKSSEMHPLYSFSEDGICKLTSTIKRGFFKLKSDILDIGTIYKFTQSCVYIKTTDLIGADLCIPTLNEIFDLDLTSESIVSIIRSDSK